MLKLENPISSRSQRSILVARLMLIIPHCSTTTFFSFFLFLPAAYTCIDLSPFVAAQRCILHPGFYLISKFPILLYITVHKTYMYIQYEKWARDSLIYTRNTRGASPSALSHECVLLWLLDYLSIFWCSVYACIQSRNTPQNERDDTNPTCNSTKLHSSSGGRVILVARILSFIIYIFFKRKYAYRHIFLQLLIVL